MEKFLDLAAQGDILIERVESVPEGLKQVAPVNGDLIVTHSESGHHHVCDPVKSELFQYDLVTSYLNVKAKEDLLIHKKDGPDRHKTMMLKTGIYKIHRQVERTPKGWTRVED